MGELEGDNLVEMFPLKYLKIVVLGSVNRGFHRFCGFLELAGTAFLGKTGKWVSVGSFGLE